MKFKAPPTDLRGYKPKTREQVTYAVSYNYNGGTGVGDEWYEGYEVPAPLISPGYGLVGIGVGLELNAKPPLATAVLKPLYKISEGTKYMDCNGQWVKK